MSHALQQTLPNPISPPSQSVPTLGLAPLSVTAATAMAMTTTCNRYPATVFQLSDDPRVRELQLQGIDALEAEFGVDRLRCHAFCWTLSDNSDVADEWRPLYEFYQPGGNKQATIEEIWKEWSVGINGCISVQRLGQYWDTRWRRADKAKKTLASQRKRIIDLVTEIMGKRRWDENRTLRYIRENYVPAKFSTVRAFIDFLQKRQKGLDGLTNFERVVENAM